MVGLTFQRFLPILAGPLPLGLWQNSGHDVIVSQHHGVRTSWWDPVMEKLDSLFSNWKTKKREKGTDADLPFKGTPPTTRPIS